jgi:methyl-accepting chemotaxis protein
MDVQSTQEELLYNTKPLVKGAHRAVGASTEATSEKMSETFDALINTEVRGLRAMLELKAAANGIAGLLLQATAARSVAQIKALNLRSDKLSVDLSKATIRLPKNPAGKAVADLGRQLTDMGLGKSSVFALRLDELSIDKIITDSMMKSRVLAGKLSLEVNGLVEGAETVLEDASINSEQAIEIGTQALTVITVISLVIAILIGWLYINRGLSMRLVRTAEVMKRLADGDLSVEITAKGNDEISAMVRTLGVFKDNALEKQRIEEEQKQAEARAQEQRRKEMLDLAQSFEASVMGIVETVSTASNQMETTAQSMLDIADQNAVNSETAAAESEHATGNVNSVAKIKAGALENRAAADQMLAAARELSQESVQLKAEVDKFLAGVRAA